MDGKISKNELKGICCHESCWQKEEYFARIKIKDIEYFLTFCKRHYTYFMNPYPKLSDYDWEYETSGDRKLPIVECKASVGGWKFYCPYCGEDHTHGPFPGHRSDHCCNERSPFKKTGYILKLKEVENDDF